MKEVHFGLTGVCLLSLYIDISYLRQLSPRLPLFKQKGEYLWNCRWMAPIVNPNRFTNEWQVEFWFDWNCELLLQRECTPQEKGDFIAWLMTIEE